MEIVNMHEAKSHLSQLAHRAAAGEKIIIGTAGMPLALLGPQTEQTAAPSRLDFLKGAFAVPDDFDHIDAETIARDFEQR